MTTTKTKTAPTKTTRVSIAPPALSADYLARHAEAMTANAAYIRKRLARFGPDAFAIVLADDAWRTIVGMKLVDAGHECEVLDDIIELFVLRRAEAVRLLGEGSNFRFKIAEIPEGAVFVTPDRVVSLDTVKP